jgi:uncharacterized protein YeaO (DUF488 family)
MSQATEVEIVRVYDRKAVVPDGAYRVLVDRLWPRGVAKADLAHDAWPKDVTPSTNHRKWYGHEAQRWEEFRRRYRAELAIEPAASALAEVREAAGRHPIVLLTAVKAVERSAAEVLAEVLSGDDPLT